MSRAGYLAIVIALLVALLGLAVFLFLKLRKDKVEREHCSHCDNALCPIARKKGEEQ